MGLRERKREQTADAIVAGAFELFASKGYADTTVDDIAEAANVSRATVFRYFPSKDDIVFGHHASAEEFLRDACARHRSEAFPYAVRAVVSEFSEHLVVEGEDMQVLSTLIDSDPRLLGRSLLAESDWVKIVVAELAGASPSLAEKVIVAAMLRASRMAFREWAATGSGDLRPVLDAALDCIAPARR